MKRKITKLMAALALLVAFALPATGWGQTTTEVTDVLNLAFTGVSGGTNYVNWSGKTSNSEAVYAGNSAGDNQSIQLRSANSNSGIVTTASGGTVTKVTVTWNSNTTSERTLNVYGKNTAYTAATDLYNSSNQGTLLGTIVYGTSTELIIDGSYEFIGMRSASGAMYLTEIDIIWATDGEAPTPTCATPTFTPAAGTYTEAQNVTIACDTEDATIHYTIDGTEPTAESAVYSDALTIEETTTVKAIAVKDDYNNSAVASATYTIVEPAGDEQWVLTNLSGLTSNDVFVIVGNNGSNYAMTNDNGTNAAPAATAVTIANDAIVSTVANNLQWTISGNATDGYTFYPNGSTTTWLYCINDNNGVRVGTNNNTTFTISTEGYLYHSGTSRYVGIYNSQDWRCYTSINNNISGQTFAFYKKVTGAVTAVATTTTIDASGITNTDVYTSTAAGTLTATVTETESGDAVSGAAVTWTSSKENVATIDEDGVVTLVGKGTTTITASYAGVSGEFGASSATYELTVTSSEPYTQPTEFEIGLNNTLFGTNYNGPVSNITDANPIVGTQDNVTVTYAGGGSHYVNDNQIRFYPNNKLTFEAPDGYEIKEIVFTASSWGITVMVGDETISSETKTWTGSASQVVFTGSGSSGNCQLTKATITLGEPSSAVATTTTIDYSGITNTDVYTSTAAGTLTATVKDNEDNEIQGATVTWTSSNENVATIDANGAVTLVAAGTTTITAHYAGEEDVYQPSSGTYGLTVTSTEPSITVVPATVNATAAETEGTLTVTYQNITEVVAEVYFCDAEGEAATYDWIEADIDNDNNVSYVIEANEGEARTAYFKVYALDDDADDVYSNLVTINQAAFVADYATLPFEFDGGKADIEGTAGLTQNGLGSDYGSSPKLRFDDTGDYLILKFNEAPGTLTFDIKGNSFSGGTFTVQTSVDGETYTDLASYTELGNTETKTFNELNESIRYIKWIYTEKVSGNVALGAITLGEYVEPQPSITIDPDEANFPASIVTGYDVVILPLTYNNITVSTFESFTVQFYDSEDQEINMPGWVVVASVAGSESEGFNVICLPDNNEGAARTAYFKVYAYDAENNKVYSNLVTINQEAYVEPFEGATYTLASTIESGRHYIVVGFDEEDAYAMGTQTNNNRTAVAININEEGKAEVESADVYEFVINGPDKNGFYTIYDAEEPGYLYAASNSSNYLRTREFNTDANSQWTITFGEEEGKAIITAQGSFTRNIMRYNSSNNLFSCYASGQQDIYLFAKDNDSEHEFYKDIKGYDNSNGNYYLIASPIADEVNPENVNHMLANEYDLYAFDQSEEQEWRNYKANVFNLEAGKGYLYANSENVTLHFTGTPNTVGTYYMQYVQGTNFAGCNLVGNPFPYAAYVNRDFYVMNETGDEIIPASSGQKVDPMEGIFVIAENPNDINVTFSAESNDNNTDGNIEMNVSQAGRGTATIDRAIIRFGESNGLGKFMLNENNTRLYIPQGDKDFAVVRSASQGEMPVSFKAAENDTYTLSINIENEEMDYLHLVDNITGADVDLLMTPSYTFEAKTSDYANRFRLVFNSTGIDDNEASTAATFAYINNGNIVINDADANATLQIVDVTGRVVLSTNIVRNVSTTGMSAGVYVLRLTNGDNVKTQKIVVR